MPIPERVGIGVNLVHERMGDNIWAECGIGFRGGSGDAMAVSSLRKDEINLFELLLQNRRCAQQLLLRKQICRPMR
jgi:hypothetical protein